MSSSVRSFFRSKRILNTNCCGGDEKKKKSMKKTNPIESSNHKIDQIIQQQALPDVTIDDNLQDLFGKKDVTKVLIQQLAQRALTAPMNTNNDNPPRLCTKKHCLFSNEPLTIKPVTCVPGIGPVHGDLCEKQGIVMAHQLLSRYMMSTNDQEFEKSLVQQLGFTSKSAAMTRDGLKELQRHLI